MCNDEPTSMWKENQKKMSENRVKSTLCELFTKLISSMMSFINDIRCWCYWCISWIFNWGKETFFFENRSNSTNQNAFSIESIENKLTHKNAHVFPIDSITIAAVLNVLWASNYQKYVSDWTMNALTLYFFWPLWHPFRSVESPRTNCCNTAFLLFKLSRSPVNCCINAGILFRFSCNDPFRPLLSISSKLNK